uniref:Sema domain-containing protein n=1 Tax=Arundo donax TaxID=35708 RepID=A0A0A9EGH4_ARUDO
MMFQLFMTCGNSTCFWRNRASASSTCLYRQSDIRSIWNPTKSTSNP